MFPELNAGFVSFGVFGMHQATSSYVELPPVDIFPVLAQMSLFLKKKNKNLLL